MELGDTITVELLNQLVYERNGDLYWHKRDASLFKNKGNAKNFNETKANQKLMPVKRNNTGAVIFTVWGKGYFAQDLMWILKTGKFPKTKLIPKDGDYNNYNFDNICEDGQTEFDIDLASNLTRGFKGITNHCGKFWRVEHGGFIAYVPMNKGKITAVKLLDYFKQIS